MHRTIVKVSVAALLLLAALSGRGRTVSQASMEQAAGNVSTVGSPAIEFSPPITQHSGGIVQPIADGSRDPESISDEVAMRALFLNIAVPPNPDGAATARLRVRAGRMMLEEDDFKILTQELGRFHESLTVQSARMAAAREATKITPTPATLAKVVEADKDLSTLVKSSYDALLAKLSAAGRDKLQRHLGYVKTRIRVIPPPDMSPKHH